MTDPVVEALVVTAPKVQLTTWQKAARLGAVLFGLIATVALALSVLAMYSTARVAHCTNTNLGTRAAPTQNDAAAHIKFAEAIDALFLPTTATVAQRQAAALTFRGQVDTYVHTLVADQAERSAHPLGKC